MPSRIQRLVDTALTDRRITPAEVDGFTQFARQDGYVSGREKQTLKSALRRNADAFEPAARDALSSFLGLSSPTPTPTPAPEPAAPVIRDLEDPAVLNSHQSSLDWFRNENGKLFVDGVSWDDVVQGQIANCYMVGAFSSVAYADPKLIENAVKDHGDGTFTVTFHDVSGWGSARKVEITVDDELPTSMAGGTSKYGRSRDRNELWVSVLEKAYAQWKGNYEAIGNGGYAGEVMSALTGRRADWTSISPASIDSVIRRIEQNVAANRPVAAGTHGKDSGVDYNGTGVYAWHVYTVTGVSRENGETYVQLRNPWGSSEPGNDGKNDGIFKMKADDFARLYSSLHFS